MAETDCFCAQIRLAGYSITSWFSDRTGRLTRSKSKRAHDSMAGLAMLILCFMRTRIKPLAGMLDGSLAMWWKDPAIYLQFFDSSYKLHLRFDVSHELSIHKLQCTSFFTVHIHPTGTLNYRNMTKSGRYLAPKFKG